MTNRDLPYIGLKCIQHYLERGYSIKYALEYLRPAFNDVEELLRIYDSIRESEKMIATVNVEPLQDILGKSDF